MNYILLIIWMLLTLVLTFSIIGLLVIAPQANDTMTYKPIDEGRRSTWMQIGLDLKNKILES